MEQIAPLRPLPNLVFRVLILGRANAGKTSILQRVCETTESPEIYRRVGSRFFGRREEKVQLNPTSQRGHHTITDEYIFANHRGYVFHDSRGFEGGDTKQWEEVQEFIRDRSRRAKLSERLHAIWFCVPMDQHQRACLDIETFDKICPDKNVPVIVLFTKYEAFKSNMQFNLEDAAEEKGAVIAENIEELTQRKCHNFFETQCLSKIGSAPYVQLEEMHKINQKCQELVDATMIALNPAVISLMLLAVQQGNVELSIRLVVQR
ncbi:Small GTP-binding protein domain [Mycena sanguinolenta]|uniref:Small GTP-binding protein domain n=1 Tax=Mycena sanguinolenta TaxID=230812 RepID=A0A8H7DJN8_9AGAR|nr:Small GTP-binding protein domain [Mycena sanguinolenta]